MGYLISTQIIYKPHETMEGRNLNRWILWLKAGHKEQTVELLQFTAILISHVLY